MDFSNSHLIIQKFAKNKKSETNTKYLNSWRKIEHRLKQ